MPTPVARRRGAGGWFDPAVPLRRLVSRGLGFSVVVYLISRIPVVLALLLLVRTQRGASPGAIALRWDGWWYVRIARLGYTSTLRPRLSRLDFHHKYSEWAFYPGYPLLVRGMHELTRLSYLRSAVVAASILGLTAVWAAYALGHLFGGISVARATALLIAVWPGSAVLSLPYGEGLFVTAAALALIFLHRQRWLLAGLFGAVALLTRATGLALLAAMVAFAVVRLKRHRDWRPLAAALVTAAGGAAFVLYGWARTGDPLVWRHAENLWGQRLDLSTALLTRVGRVLSHPGSPLVHHQLLTTIQETVGLLMLVLMGVAAVRTAQPRTTTMVVYAVAVVASILGYSAVGPRPRMVLAVLPGFVWLGGWLPRRLIIALSACSLVLLGVVSYQYWQVPP